MLFVDTYIIIVYIELLPLNIFMLENYYGI